MRVLCLSGGGFKGALQVPIIIELMARHDYDLILGVSVGSINGVLAAQDDLDVLKEFWDALDDKSPLFGVKGFLSPAVHRWKALYSLNPLRRHLEEHVSLAKLKINYGCGIVLKEGMRESREYITALSENMGSDKELHEMIVGSSAIAGFMEPGEWNVDGKDRLLFDGGHLHVLPKPPKEATIIDAVFCDLLKPNRRRANKNNLIDNILWGMDTLEDKNRIADFEDLKVLAESGVKINVYAPHRSPGGRLEANQDIIRYRYKLGRRALKNPIIL
jgi:hypothetical protein